MSKNKTPIKRGWYKYKGKGRKWIVCRLEAEFRSKNLYIANSSEYNLTYAEDMQGQWGVKVEMPNG